MSNRKIIAFFGGVLYEEKNYKFLYELGKIYSAKDYLLIAFSFSNDSVWQYDTESPEVLLINFADTLNLSAVILQLEYIRNDTLTRAVVEMGHRKNIPVIAMERPFPGCINVKMDHKSAFKSIVRHIVEYHKCQNIVLMAGIKGERFSEERIQAFKEVLDENDIPFNSDHVDYGDYIAKNAERLMLKRLNKYGLPDAVICASDQMAFGVYSALHEKGIKVPENVVITGYDGISSANYHDPSITTVAPDFTMEAEIIAEKISSFNGVYTDEIFSTGHELLLTESCGCTAVNPITHKMIAELSDSYYDVNWATGSMNDLTLHAATISSMTEFSEALRRTLWIWNDNFQFVAIKSSLFNDDKSKDDDTYVSLFRHEQDNHVNEYREFKTDEFIPDFDRVLDSHLHFVSVRLLHIADRILGYVAEGCEKITHRNLRRVEEYGMFLSSAINSVNDNRRMKKLYEELETSSIMDYLTGIYNRRGFYRTLNKIISDPDNLGKNITLLSIDMDGLKEINDTYGHEEGDFALKQVADSIKCFVYAIGEGISARYGGDEFAACILSDKECEYTSVQIESELSELALKNEMTKNKKYKIGSSVGKYQSIITKNINIDALMQIADKEMYENKSKKHHRT